MTQKPRDSGLRDAFLGILMTVGPFFGVRYRPPRVEIPVVTTPAGSADEPAAATTSAPDQSPGRRNKAPEGDGIIF